MSDLNALPNNYVEATLKQHPDIDEMLNKVTKEMAKCSIRMDRHGDDVFDALNHRFNKARHNQQMLLHNALWRKVEFEDNRFHSA